MVTEVKLILSKSRLLFDSAFAKVGFCCTNATAPTVQFNPVVAHLIVCKQKHARWLGAGRVVKLWTETNYDVRYARGLFVRRVSAIDLIKPLRRAFANPPLSNQLHGIPQVSSDTTHAGAKLAATIRATLSAEARMTDE